MFTSCTAVEAVRASGNLAMTHSWVKAIVAFASPLLDELHIEMTTLAVEIQKSFAGASQVGVEAKVRRPLE